MKYRKLRIAWSVAWGVACLLLLVLWVRSYFYEDGVGMALSRDCVAWVDSVTGRAIVSFRRENPAKTTPLIPNVWHERIDPESLPTIERNTAPHVLGFGVVHQPPYSRLRFPYWFLATSAATMAVVPWLTRYLQFSLRKLLIGMTVAAIGLGWIVYAIRG